MADIPLTKTSPTMERWKNDKQIKKAKKQAIKQLVSEGSSVRLAKKLVDDAYKRVKHGNE